MSYFTPGQQLKKGQYEIIDILGQGGFGVTYLAQDHKRKTQVTIKSLNVLFLQQRYRVDTPRSKDTGILHSSSKLAQPGLHQVE
jgi:serine/threonine protein kinase